MTEPALFTATPNPEEDVTTTLYRAAIGPVSTGYYLPIFSRFEAADHAGISWNTAASLLTLNWLVFRKLWVASLAYVGTLVAVALLVFGIGHVVLQFSNTLMMILGLGFGLLVFVLPGLFGNALFHTECRKAMSKALVGHANVADARDALLGLASTRSRAMWLAAANVVCLLIGFVVYTQVAAFSSVTVLPQGALDAGQVSMGRTVDGRIAPVSSAPAMAAPIAMVSTASTPLDVAPTASSAASASAPMAPTSVATPAASAPQAVASGASREIAAAPTAENALAINPAVEAKPKNEKVEADSKDKTPQAVPTPTVKPAKPAKPSASNSTHKESASRPYFINVGLFSIPENAERANAKLLEAKLPSVVKELKSTKGRQIRVRVGPLANQAEAAAAAAKIKTLQLDASIIRP
jgi:cell division protein FtsN